MNDNDTETRVRPVSMKRAIYRDKHDGKWYWTVDGFSRPVGPFESREEARMDFRHVMTVKIK